MQEKLSEIFSKEEEFSEDILKAFESRQLVFFIGAGVSRIMGIPGWNDLSENLIRKAFPAYDEQTTILRDVTDNKERITIAHKKFEDENNLKGFYDIFGQAMKPNKHTFESKENIYEILNRFNAVFLTTNADNLFEEVLGSALCHEDYNPAILKSEHQRKQNHLFYLHGHYTENINIEKNNLVFTAPQYVSRYNDDQFIEFIQTIFDGKNTVIFIGYGLNEFELIDYIVTKTNYSKDQPRKVFIFYGFCENDDVLFQAKTTYFESLNIGLIPYNMTINGYDSLIDKLKNLNEYYMKNAIVPMSEFIADCIKDYTPDNHLSIVKILNDINQAHTKEPQIVSEIKQLGGHQWTEQFFNDKLFSTKRLNEKISYRAWPLLELFVNWVESEEENAQIAAVNFLEELNEEQIELLADNHSHINAYITRMVLALNKTHITAKYIDLIFIISLNKALFFHEYRASSAFQRMLTWDLRLIRRFFNNLFSEIDLDDFHNDNSYMMKQFFKSFNNAVSTTRIAHFVFQYFRDLIISYSTKKDFNLFSHIRSLDNIEKNHQEYWKIIFREINFSFSKLTQQRKKALIIGLLSNEIEASQKLGLYLARKYDLNVSSYFSNPLLFSSNDCFHECYLLLKHHTEKCYLEPKIENDLVEIICNTSFGLEKLSIPIDREDWQQHILSKRLLLLQLLKCNDAKKIADGLISDGVEVYNSEQIADECDYVHGGEWVNKVQLSVDTFSDNPPQKWCEVFLQKCSNIEDSFALSDCAVQFSRILLEQSQEDLDVVISSFKNLPKTILGTILQQLRSNRDKLSSHRVLIEICLEILDEMIVDGEIDKELAKIIFTLISDINPQDLETVKQIMASIEPWLIISIDGSSTFDGDHHILTNLINFGDFEKLSAWINSKITLKKLDHFTWKERDTLQLIDMIKNDTSNKTIRYTCCYHYQKLKHLTGEYFSDVHKILLNSKDDTTPLLFCILNSQYIFKELVDEIKAIYLSNPCAIPSECKDGILTHQLYGYVISSRFHNHLTQKEFECAFIDTEFLNYFLHHLSYWAKEDNFVLDDWLIPCWRFIKANYAEDKRYTYAEALLHSLNILKKPTNALLRLYIEVNASARKETFVHPNVSALLSFFEIDSNLTADFIFSYFELDCFIEKNDLKLILSKHKEYGLERKAHKLLIMLSEKGEISNPEKEQLAKECL